ncbi:MAG: glycosyltransferase, partial [Clostridiales bacterium]|nr:glycosyltransferase [Clostridiales bacterium]
MKLLLIDTLSTGHHISYLQALAKVEAEVAVVVPTGAKIEATKVYYLDFWKNGKRHYLGWLYGIDKIIRQWKPDVVHFVYGDDLYRHMGVGIGAVCRNCRSIVTLHQVRYSKLRDVSKQVLARQVDAVVVHTEQTKADLLKLGIKNVYRVEYPQFCQAAQIPKQTALEKLGLGQIDKPVLLALGGTRWDKGLDILLDALADIKVP